MQSLLYAAVVILGHIFLARGHGVVKIQFVKYENNGGLGANGECCDGKWGICQRNGCDHMFTICLDAPGKPNDVTRCQYGKMQSKAVKDQDVITFGPKIADLPNPLTFNINSALPAEFDFKIVVFDHDKGFGTGSHDHVDTMTQRIKTEREQNYVTKSRTKLVFKVTMVCHPNYYGQRCDKLCPAPTASSHYKCNLVTGQKECLPGWTGADCQTTKSKPCDPNPCKNGGSCVEKEGKATCICQSKFQGSKCETPIRAPVPVKIPKPAPGPSKQQQEIDAFFSTPEPAPPKMEAGDNDCDTLAKGGFLYMDGTYNIKPKGSSKTIKVYCEMTNEGWTVIQRRKQGTLNFNQNWQSYKDGFGKVGASEDFWLGLDNIHYITKQNPGKYKLRIKIKTYDGRWLKAEYNRFSIDDEAHDYRLHVSGYSGDAGDALNLYSQAGRVLHNEQRFSTSDRDKDNSRSNCAQKYRSGWWFNDCLTANLNGPILEVSPYRKPSCGDSPCMSWNGLSEYTGTPILASIMMIKPN